MSRIYFSLTARRIIVALTLIFGLSLILGLQPTTVSANTTPQIDSISANSGAAGSFLTIKGHLNGNYYHNDGLCDLESRIVTLFVKTSSGYIYFGVTVAENDKTFSWRGVMPGSGYQMSFPSYYIGEDDPQTTIPTGNISLVAFSPDNEESDPIDFNLTNNQNGPFANYKGLQIVNQWHRNPVDFPVDCGGVTRSYIYGPKLDAFVEPYKEAPQGWRTVVYYDKARLEVGPGKDEDSGTPYNITSGLLVRELVSGRLQLGDDTFENREPAKVPAAGDLTDANRTPPFAAYTSLQDRNDNKLNQTITQQLSFDEQVSTNADFARYGVTATNPIKETNHYIASPFWQYINAKGKLYSPCGCGRDSGEIIDIIVGLSVTGYPITEPYWTKTLVGGVEKDVLVQLFERRSLTYTPSNPPAYQVEMGNVGLEYFQWRYSK